MIKLWKISGGNISDIWLMKLGLKIEYCGTENIYQTDSSSKDTKEKEEVPEELLVVVEAVHLPAGHQVQERADQACSQHAAQARCLSRYHQGTENRGHRGDTHGDLGCPHLASLHLQD